jgi:polar amino acid transport system substrate-binding protein
MNATQKLFAFGTFLAALLLSAFATCADPLRDELAPSGKLRVAIAISPAGGAFWCTKAASGDYAGVPVDLGTAMAAEAGVSAEFMVYQNSGQIAEAAASGKWDVSFLPRDTERMAQMDFGPTYAVADATYIVKSGSSITTFQQLDEPGIKIAAVDATTTMRGAIAHLKQATVTGYQTYDEIFDLLKTGNVDAFALSRDQLIAMSKKIPGTRVLDETFKQTITAVAVPPKHPLSLAFVSRFMTHAKSNGLLRRVYDTNGMKDTPIQTN